MITVKHRGNFKHADNFLNRMLRRTYLNDLQKYGEEGVRALAAATPKDTGLTAASWSYEIIQEDGRVRLVWKNSNINDGVSIAVILQYGHGTRNGGYVQGRDYINPAIAPIFDKIADNAWKEVTRK